MNKAIVDNWNSTVNMGDDVYVLGDLMLNNNDKGIKLLKSLKGNIHIVLGNHDTNTRVELYNNCWNVVEIESVGIMLNYDNFRFVLTHYPMITSNIDEMDLSQHLINLYGHTHQKTNFYNDIPWIYHVGVNSHNCTPVSIEQVIEDMKKEYKKCASML